MSYVVKVLLFIGFFFIHAAFAVAVSPSEIPTDLYRKFAVPLDEIRYEKELQVTPGEKERYEIPRPVKGLPKFQICLRHYLTGQCIAGKKNNFFSCDRPKINDYLQCISDPKLPDKILMAYKRMEAQAKEEIARLEEDKKTNPAEKALMLEKMRASLKQYEDLGPSDADKYEQIGRELDRSERFKIAENLKSPKFLAVLEDACTKRPDLCLGADEYKEYGRKLLKNFERTSDEINAGLKKAGKTGLDERLAFNMEDIEKCQAEKLNGEVGDYCSRFTPEQELMDAVQAEIKSGACQFKGEAKILGPKAQARLLLVCGKYYQYFSTLAKKDNDRGGGQSTVAPMVDERKVADKKTTASVAFEGGREDGKSIDREGLKWEMFARLLKEEPYTCESVATEMREDCQEGPAKAVVEKDVLDLAHQAKKAASACSKEINAYHRAQIDAASYLLETQFRAYVDRLNFDKNLTRESYQKNLEQFILSCDPGEAKKATECDYDGLVRRETQEYVKRLANQALLLKDKAGWQQDLGTGYQKDMHKASQDLKEIDATIKDLLGNFPSKGFSLKDVWPEMLPCQSVVELIDDAREEWGKTHYEGRCPPLDVAQAEKIWKEEEAFYEEYHSVEAGLLPGKTLKDYPADRVAYYEKLKSEKGVLNDLAGKVNQDALHSSMFNGRASGSGRILIEPSTLTGLESRRYECKKKADQVKKLLQMKVSVLSNYPQLATKTFKNGKRPSKAWVHWEENCAGGKASVTRCSHGDCDTFVRKGCEKPPTDGTGERPRPLYEQLDGTDDPGKMGLQLSLAEAQDDLDSLKDAARSICKDPLEAGKDVITDDKLYTLYASCAIQNVQNGERRDETDVDEYQFWRPVNSSAASRSLCAKRAAESHDRCHIARHLNSTLGHQAGKGLSAIASPLMKGLDILGCLAMFTGVGGAIYSGVSAGAKGGVASGLRAGVKSLGREALASAKNMVTPVGGILTGAGAAMTYHQSVVAEEDYNKVKARHAAGLASADDVEEARKTYEMSKMSSNITSMIAGAFIPSGDADKVHVPKAKVHPKVKYLDPAVLPLRNKEVTSAVREGKNVKAPAAVALGLEARLAAKEAGETLADDEKQLLGRLREAKKKGEPDIVLSPTEVKVFTHAPDELAAQKENFVSQYGVETPAKAEAMGLPTSANNRSYLELAHGSGPKKVVVFNMEMTVLKDGNEVLGREAMTAAENLYQQTVMDVMKTDESGALIWKSMSRTDEGSLQKMRPHLDEKTKSSVITLLKEKARPPTELSGAQKKLLAKLEALGKDMPVSVEDVAALYRMFTREMNKLSFPVLEKEAMQFKRMMEELAQKHPLTESEKLLAKRLADYTGVGTFSLKAGEISLLEGMSTRIYTGFKSMEGAVDWDLYRQNLAAKLNVAVDSLDDATVGKHLREDFARMDEEVKARFVQRMESSGMDLSGIKGKISGERLGRPEDWKTMGISKIPPDGVGSPIDEAALAARAARGKGGTKGVAAYDGTLGKSVVAKVTDIEGTSTSPGLRKKFMKATSDRGLSQEQLVKSGFYSAIPDEFLTKAGYKGPRPQYAVSERIWAVMRKSDDLDKATERLNSMFPDLHFTKDETKMLRAHYESLDALSPAIHSGVRGSIPVSESLGRGGVLDVQGLGGLNAQWNDTASMVASLTGVATDPASIMALARKAEAQGSTPAFKKRVEGMVRTVQDELGPGWVVKASGDDVVFFPERRSGSDRRGLASHGGRRGDPALGATPGTGQLEEKEINSLVNGLDRLSKKGHNNPEFGGSSLSRATFVRGEGAQEAHITLMENVEKNVRQGLEKNVAAKTLSLDDLSHTVIGFDAQVPKEGKAIIRVVVPKGSGISNEMLGQQLKAQEGAIGKSLGGRPFEVKIDRI